MARRLYAIAARKRLKWKIVSDGKDFAIGDRVRSYGAVSDIHVTDESTLRRLPHTVTDYDAACQAGCRDYVLVPV